MGRAKGAANKQPIPAPLVMSEEERIALVATILLEIVIEEQGER